MENLLMFEEFCSKCTVPVEDKEDTNIRKKSGRNKYKEPYKDKKREIFMKKLMKDRIKK